MYIYSFILFTLLSINFIAFFMRSDVIENCIEFFGLFIVFISKVCLLPKSITKDSVVKKEEAEAKHK